MTRAFHAGGHGRRNADASHAKPHPMTAPARVVDGQLSYVPPEPAGG